MRARGGGRAWRLNWNEQFDREQYLRDTRRYDSGQAQRRRRERDSTPGDDTPHRPHVHATPYVDAVPLVDDTRAVNSLQHAHASSPTAHVHSTTPYVHSATPYAHSTTPSQTPNCSPVRSHARSSARARAG